MGRKGKCYQHMKCITLTINGMKMAFEMKSNELINNVDQLKIIPFIFNMNSNKHKSTKRCKQVHIKRNMKQQKEKNELTIQQELNFDDQSNTLNSKYNNDDTNIINTNNLLENSLLTENVEYSIFNVFNNYEDFNEENDETDDLFFDIEQNQYF